MCAGGRAGVVSVAVLGVAICDGVVGCEVWLLFRSRDKLGVVGVNGAMGIGVIGCGVALLFWSSVVLLLWSGVVLLCSSHSHVGVLFD